MRRRSFLQSIIGGLAALFVPKSKADVITTNGTDEVKDWRSLADVNPVMLGDGNYEVFHKQILDICSVRDYIYVLLEGGELWRAYKGGEYFGKPFLTWQRVHQYIWPSANKIFERSPGLLAGVEIGECGSILYCGEYYVEA